MCCCGKPVVNGEPGYRWQPSDVPSVRRPNAPSLREEDTLLYDEPGRCGGLDSHCHHYRVVKRYSSLYLLVRHGGGDDGVGLSSTLRTVLDSLDSNTRYWTLNAFYRAYQDGERIGRESVTATWRQAAADKRIKMRKVRGSAIVKVWIEPKQQ